MTDADHILEALSPRARTMLRFAAEEDTAGSSPLLGVPPTAASALGDMGIMDVGALGAALDSAESRVALEEASGISREACATGAVTPTSTATRS